ncbi:MAG: SRPBCC family protein [Geothrix sp.]|uniref:SRPBCC family protein n=1 Tax=Geothrix sp. TaxID=1962974 RepID=UPI003BB1A09E
MPAHRVSSPVDASPDTVWAVLLDKMAHPQRYIEDALDAEILDRDDGSVVRQLVLPGGVSFHEHISSDSVARTITFTLLDHPLYEGTVINRLLQAPAGGVELVFELDWRPRPGCVDDRGPEGLPALIQSSILHTKRIAEALENGA